MAVNGMRPAIFIIIFASMKAKHSHHPRFPDPAHAVFWSGDYYVNSEAVQFEAFYFNAYHLFLLLTPEKTETTFLECQDYIRIGHWSNAR